MEKKYVGKEGMQAYYDEAVNYILNQEKRCVNARGTCVFSDGAGNRCVVGHFIPDGHRVFKVHNRSGIMQIAHIYPELSGIVWPETIPDDTGIDLANELQGLHDNEYYREGIDKAGLFIYGWGKVLSIADEFDLVPVEKPES